jgi:hypothetical protein
VTGTDVLDYYRSHSPVTDPRGYGYLFDGLPGELTALVRVVQGLFVHTFAAGRYGLPPGRDAPEDRIRMVPGMLAAITEIHDAPLTIARDPGRRLVGNCRQPAVLLTAMLRHKGIPARKRVGFARYLPGPCSCIHEIIQYWDAGECRWKLVDPGNDELVTASQRAFFASIGQPHRAGYDTLDLGPEDFVLAAAAWRQCRGGHASPGEFGYGDDRGTRWLRQTVLQDLDALNKAELCSADSWGGPLTSGPADPAAERARYLDRAETTPAEARFLDQMAELATDADRCLGELRRRYAGSAWGQGVRDKLRTLPAAAAGGQKRPGHPHQRPPRHNPGQYTEPPDITLRTQGEWLHRQVGPVRLRQRVLPP